MCPAAHWTAARCFHPGTIPELRAHRVYRVQGLGIQGLGGLGFRAQRVEFRAYKGSGLSGTSSCRSKYFLLFFLLLDALSFVILVVGS